MLLYNVTVKIDSRIEEDWLRWMKLEHIPAVLATGKFSDAQMSRLLDQTEDDGRTYVIQYRCLNREQYDGYLNEHAAALRDQHDERYKGRYVAFRTLMEVL